MRQREQEVVDIQELRGSKPCTAVSFFNGFDQGIPPLIKPKNRKFTAENSKFLQKFNAKNANLTKFCSIHHFYGPFAVIKFF